MIRKLRKIDVEYVAKIWLDTNIKAHDFISAEYWKSNFVVVKEMLLQAEIYIYEEAQTKEILGFIGLNNNYIEGFFVCGKSQSQGVGKQLLNFVKGKKSYLQLRVYYKNERAVQFYKREEFQIESEKLDEDTGEKEYIMAWND